jgi:hypothetical protein
MVEIKEPETWKLVKESRSELMWEHKHSDATIYLRYGSASKLLLTIYDPRERGIGKTEGTYPNGQKEAVRQLAIEYMLMHP